MHEVTSDSMNKSATLDALLMELGVQYKLKFLHNSYILVGHYNSNHRRVLLATIV